MNTHDAFDQLIQSIESELISIKQKGKDHFDNDEISRARETLDKAEKIQEFILEINSLKEKWEQKFPVTAIYTQTEDDVNYDDDDEEEEEEDDDDDKEEEKVPDNQSQKYYSSQSDFYQPILQAMVDLGGGGEKKEVINQMKINIAGEGGSLNETRSRNKQKSMVWKQNFRNATVSLEKEGYISGYSITDKGREFLEKRKN